MLIRETDNLTQRRPRATSIIRCAFGSGDAYGCYESDLVRTMKELKAQKDQAAQTESTLKLVIWDLNKTLPEVRDDLRQEWEKNEKLAQELEG